jgi:hypothetical protein
VVNVCKLCYAIHAEVLQPTRFHPDTQAIFTSVALFNARNLAQFRGYPEQWPAFPSMSRFPVFPEHITAIGQYYFRFERNNAMETDREPCMCIEYSIVSSLKFHQHVIFCSLKSQDDLNHFKSQFMYLHKRDIFEWGRWNYKNLRSWTNFAVSRRKWRQQ